MLISTVIESFGFGHNSLTLTDFSLFERDDTRHGKEVGNEFAFDSLIEGGVAVEGGGEVDFEEPGVELVVDEDVEAEELEAIVAEGDVLLAGVEDYVLGRQNRLDNHILDLLEDSRIVYALLSECFSQSLE